MRRVRFLKKSGRAGRKLPALLCICLLFLSFNRLSLRAEEAVPPENSVSEASSSDLIPFDPAELGELEENRTDSPLPLEAESVPAGEEQREEVPLVRETFPVEAGWPSLDEIGARSYIVAEAESGRVLLQANADEEAYPASMTKIMTALLVLESPDYDPQKEVLFSETACAMPAAESATAGFLPGELAPTIVCLKAMMTRSANEVANALAETYGPGMDAFVARMNTRARELGCEHTNFVDPCGFGYVDHHTTARDYLKICMQAMKNPLFRELASTKLYSVPATNLHPLNGWSSLINSNYLMTFQDSCFRSPWLKSIDGIKTGNTDIAGDCLASAASTWDGRQIIAIIFDAQYRGETTNSYVGPSIMSHTLLVEAARILGAPREDQLSEAERSQADLRSSAPENSSSALPSAAPGPLYTLVAASGTEGSEETEAGGIRLSRWGLALLLILLCFFLLLSLLFGLRLWELHKYKRYFQDEKWR